MPNPQAAKQSVYELSTPAADGPVSNGKWSSKYHTQGPVTFIFTTPLATKSQSVQVEVSDDNADWNDVTVGIHGHAGAATLIPRGNARMALNFRPGIDKYVRITGSGGDRVQLMIVGGEGLEPMNTEQYRNDFPA